MTYRLLTVLHDGTATNPVLAPRLKKLDEVRGHSIMIHAGGDNHSDHPAPLGGGGPRMACGVIKISRFLKTKKCGQF